MIYLGYWTFGERNGDFYSYYCFSGHVYCGRASIYRVGKPCTAPVYLKLKPSLSSLAVMRRTVQYCSTWLPPRILFSAPATKAADGYVWI